MEWWQILILIIAGAIAVRFSFNLKFDLNRYLEERRKTKLDQLKNICPHCKIEFVEDGRVGVQSYFSSPPGTYKYVCSRCHLIVESEDKVKKMGENYAKDPKRFLKNEKRFYKKIKKLGLA